MQQLNDVSHSLRAFNCRASKWGRQVHGTLAGPQPWFESSGKRSHGCLAFSPLSPAGLRTSYGTPDALKSSPSPGCRSSRRTRARPASTASTASVEYSGLFEISVMRRRDFSVAAHRSRNPLPGEDHLVPVLVGWCWRRPHFGQRLLSVPSRALQT